MGGLELYLGVMLAGLVSFLSPCVLPLVPPYLGYLGGTTIDMMTAENGHSNRAVHLRVIRSALFFVLGFTTVFVALGASASFIGRLLFDYKSELAMVAGVVIILFGLHFIGVFKIPLFYREARMRANVEPASYLGAYVIGLAFAFGWTPCIGPILAAVLTAAANEASIGRGVSLLLVYSLGLGIPFMLAALAIRPFMSFMKRFKKHLGSVEKVMGIALVLTGILFLTGSINMFGQGLLDTFPGLQNIEEWFTPKGLGDEILKQSSGG